MSGGREEACLQQKRRRPPPNPRTGGPRGKRALSRWKGGPGRALLVVKGMDQTRKGWTHADEGHLLKFGASFRLAPALVFSTRMKAFCGSSGARSAGSRLFRVDGLLTAKLRCALQWRHKGGGQRDGPPRVTPSRG